MKRVLLTGAGPNGFIGRNIAPYLNERYVLFTPSSRELDLIDYDKVAGFLDENRIDTVIHGAAQSLIHTDGEDVMKHDLQMYFNLDKLSKQLDKIIVFGSGAAYDKRLPMDMIKEDDIGRSVPEWYYALEKYIMTLHARSSKNLYVLHLFGVFGRYEHWQSKFISNLCCKAMYGLPLTIRQNCMFDYMYINDLPPIVEWFIENRPLYQDYNVCTGEPVDLFTIAKIVRKVSGKELPIEIASEGWNKAYTADNTRLKSEIGEMRLHSLEQAIKELYEYYVSIGDMISEQEVGETR